MNDLVISFVGGISLLALLIGLGLWFAEPFDKPPMFTCHAVNICLDGTSFEQVPDRYCPAGTMECR
jgi:hypothetical protein